ncbi:MAG: cytochrome c family protein [Novosphingobium sp.]|nr:cytochrome c family protein [Novosphingobium sp.]
MEDRFNTIAGWVLGSGIVALGLSTLSAHYFLANKPERPEKMGYAIAGVVSSEGGAAAETPIATRLAAADPAKGGDVFKKCTSCHTVNQGGANGIGPNLYGVVGDSVAQGRGGFAFSDALKSKGGKWDFATLDAWLKNPREFAPGTKMTFAGISDGQDRANVIAYLNTQGSNLPLPKAAPAPAAAAGVKAGATGAGTAPTGAAAASAGAPAGAAPAAGATSAGAAASASASPAGANDAGTIKHP